MRGQVFAHGFNFFWRSDARRRSDGRDPRHNHLRLALEPPTERAPVRHSSHTCLRARWQCWQRSLALVFFQHQYFCARFYQCARRAYAVSFLISPRARCGRGRSLSQTTWCRCRHLPAQADQGQLLQHLAHRTTARGIGGDAVHLRGQRVRTCPSLDVHEVTGCCVSAL